MHNLLAFLIKNISWFLFILLELVGFSLVFEFNSYQRSIFFNATNELRGRVYSISGKVSSYFGMRWGRMHYGIDLKVQVGDTIRAAFDGKVRICQYEGRGYGYYVVVRHSNGLETVYGHLSEFLVSEDEAVKSGEAIALGGNTGRSTGPHLHFETRFLGRPFNPAQIINFDTKLCYNDSYLVNTKSISSPASSRNYAYEKSKKTKKGSNKYASVKYHRIKKGDTLASIARRYGVTVKKLCSLNNLNSRTTLKTGKSLRVS